MTMIPRSVGLLLAILAGHLALAQQSPVPMGVVPDSAGFAYLKQTFGKHKKMPAQYEKEILTALSFFPELKDRRIDFVLRKGYAPLSSRPSFGGLLRSSRKRLYKVFISTGRGDGFDSINLSRAPYNARIGVLGHEISHVKYFSGKSGLALTWLGVMHVSKSYMDRFEFRTDSLCIAQGMGDYLLSMSIFARGMFGSPDPEQLSVKGEMSQYKERYMSPATIRRYMQDHPPVHRSSF